MSNRKSDVPCFVSLLLVSILLHINWSGAAPTDGRFNEEPLRVVWNSPTKDCETKYGISIDVTKYGIKENEDDDWMGSQISLFYCARLGLYPRYTADGRPINGGLPQSGDIMAHLQKASEDLRIMISEADYKGLAVIDWESWRPIWERDYDSKAIYRQMSEAKVKAEHPDWPSEKVQAMARVQFESGAREYMEMTLQLVRRMRPQGLWGFYGFPRCYNDKGEPTCSDKVMKENNELMWLFGASSVLYPTAYLSYTTVNDTAYIHGQVLEALRVRKKLKEPRKPIYMYSTYRRSEISLYTEAALNASLRQAADMGVAGLTLWGASSESDSEETCTQVRDYLHHTLGPYVARLLKEKSSCSERRCSGRGRCVLRRTMEEVEEASQRADQHWALRRLSSYYDLLKLWSQHFSAHTSSKAWGRLRSWYDRRELGDTSATSQHVCQCFEGAEGDRCEVLTK